MNVLLLEDDTATSQTMELMLKSDGINCSVTDLGEEGVYLASLYDYDIILLDINLPDISGFEVLKTLRMNGVKTPLIIVSGLAAVEDKVQGLSLGADDYMTKPFHCDELLARIRAVVRRTNGNATSQITIGNMTIDLDNKSVTIAGSDLHCIGRQYTLLEALAMRRNKVLTKNSLFQSLYGAESDIEIKLIDVFICKLRKKLASAGAAGFDIAVDWGNGYQIKEQKDFTLPANRNAKVIASEICSKIAADYHSGAKFDKLCIKYDLPESTIYTCLKREGVKLNGRPRR